jgi:hypothetical protein
VLSHLLIRHSKITFSWSWLPKVASVKFLEGVTTALKTLLCLGQERKREKLLGKVSDLESKRVEASLNSARIASSSRWYAEVSVNYDVSLEVKKLTLY